ncbi:MAG TPA: MFS transporter [Acetobacteraceae bacterium]
MAGRMTRLQKITILAAVIGNGLEWYNFMLYGVFAAVIARLYFPTENPLTSLLLSLATFGAGFFMRPLGGILLGIYSDRVGRKPALGLTIMLMCIGTVIIAVTPTYATIGLAAPLLLVLARLLQGFSTGGEMGNATAYMRDYAPPERRAYFFSWVYASSGLFIGLGLAVGTLVSALFSHDALYAWGWRIPFVLGLVIGPVGYVMRTRIPEPPAMLRSEQRHGRPLQHVLTHHLREAFATGALFVLSTICTYVLLVYTPIYTVHTLKLPQIDGFYATILGTVCIGVLTPVVGRLVDRFGPKPFLRGSALLLIVLAWPMFSYVNAGPTFAGLLVFQVVFAVVIAGYQGAILTGIGLMFPARTLATGLSLADNIAVAVFGGSAAFIITSLIALTGSHMVPAAYLTVGALIGLWGTLTVPGSGLRTPQVTADPIRQPVEH